jgi:hypothetical protein
VHAVVRWPAACRQPVVQGEKRPRFIEGKGAKRPRQHFSRAGALFLIRRFIAPRGTGTDSPFGNCCETVRNSARFLSQGQRVRHNPSGATETDAA